MSFLGPAAHDGFTLPGGVNFLAKQREGGNPPGTPQMPIERGRKRGSAASEVGKEQKDAPVEEKPGEAMGMLLSELGLDPVGAHEPVAPGKSENGGKDEKKESGSANGAAPLSPSKQKTMMGLLGGSVGMSLGVGASPKSKRR